MQMTNNSSVPTACQFPSTLYYTFPEQKNLAKRAGIVLRVVFGSLAYSFCRCLADVGCQGTIAPRHFFLVNGDAPFSVLGFLSSPPLYTWLCRYTLLSSFVRNIWLGCRHLCFFHVLDEPRSQAFPCSRGMIQSCTFE